MPGGLPGWTARPDVPETRGDPRLPRQQARRRLPRGRKLAHTARQEGCQGISQRGGPRNSDLPRAGRPVVRRPRLRSVLARATHQNPEGPKVDYTRVLLLAVPAPSGQERLGGERRGDTLWL